MWDTMTPRERRISLAEDVLMRLNAEELNIKKGNYISSSKIVTGLPSSGPITQEHCGIIRENCEMCAKGALFLSRIDKFNSVEWQESNYDRYVRHIRFNDENVVAGLDGAFSKTDLLLIEAVFEYAASYAQWAGLDEIEAAKYREYGLTFDTRSECMRAICENIIKNGEFVLPGEEQ